MNTCIRCFGEVDGRAIHIPEFNNLGLDEGKLCDGCQQELTRSAGCGAKAQGFLTNHPVLHCLRCGYAWEAESAKLPGTCPNKKCRSPYWNKPRTKGVVPSA